MGNKTKDAEIAFFGGSFTAIDREYMIELLTATKEYIHYFKGIRISTRPDAIDVEILDILRSFGVTSIELGAQSMVDSVLLANDRGHTSDDVVNASELIKSMGFSLGLQMMTGLYKSTTQDDFYTAKRFIDLSPDTVRIYPTVVLKNTQLAEYMLNGVFNPLSVDESVELCSELILMFEKASIQVIRVGLHDSETLRRNMIGGAFHPAFRELCEAHIYFKLIIEKLNSLNIDSGLININVPIKDMSKVVGQKGSNKEKLISLGYNPTFIQDKTLAARQVLVTKG